ncbi:sensor histidine kinase [Faunimonas sp. B44]|uniref:sensor histidine kinase n=1 Tax=Faunimonas sp. B44 TaxID=3461493 RepID=UPI0040451247
MGVTLMGKQEMARGGAASSPEIGSRPPLCATEAPTDALRWFWLAQLLHDLPIALRFTLATCPVLFTFAVQQLFLPEAADYPFIYFVPAVLFSSLFLARGAGLWTVVLSAALIAIFLLPSPARMDLLSPRDLIALLLFVGTGWATVIVCEALHDALFGLASANSRLSEANRRIAASEEEKELLLDEVTHRFKNDLANLTAILRLQANDTSDQIARAELLAASDRVHVLDRVHRRLSMKEKVGIVEVSAFLSELCEDLRAALIGSRPIELTNDIERSYLPLTQAITIGLVTNELITNALKHAFPDGRPGTITVRLKKEGGTFCLSTADNGNGERSAVPSTGLGQRLVRSMAQLLRGRYEMIGTPQGTTCTLSFPAN